MDKKQRMVELVDILNRASGDYYSGREESMTNFEWDALFDELAQLEAETGITLPNSPTQMTSAAPMDEGKETGVKEPHEFPTLSLAKTKEVKELQAWAGDRPIWLTWKLDDKYISINYISILLTRLRKQRNKPLCNFV